MKIAFVLGNGVSRRVVDLADLRLHGKVYGCNALYREFTPDVLVATDKPIAEAIQKSKYAQNNLFYTRKPIAGLGAKSLPKVYQGFSSGPNALALASADQYNKIYLLGFDLGGNMGFFNNLYADSDFYKKSLDKPTYSGNWIKQIAKICNDFPLITYTRVIGKTSADIENFKTIKNLDHMDIDQFCVMLNSKKGLL